MEYKKKLIEAALPLEAINFAAASVNYNIEELLRASEIVERKTICQNP